MYLLSFILFMALCVAFLAVVMGGGLSAVAYFIDMPSLIIIVLIVVPTLISAGLLRDFNNAFKLSIKMKENTEKKTLLRAAEAVSLAIKAIWAAGIFSVVFSFAIALAARLGDTEKLMAYLYIALIPMLYASFLVIILLPVKARLNVKLKEYDILDSVQDNTNTETSRS